MKTEKAAKSIGIWTKPGKQRLALQSVMNGFAGYYGEKHAANYEFKQFLIGPAGYGNVLSVVIEAGRIGDEGTMGEAIGRNYAHFFVGPRGALWTYIDGTRRRLKWWQVPSIQVYEREAREKKETNR